MKIAMVGNYAVYFIPRLLHFNHFLNEKNWTLYVIEESDNHRLYSFAASDEKKRLNRIVLFSSGEVVISSKLRERTNKVLDEINPDVVVTGFISFPFGAIGLKWAKANSKAVVEYDDQKLDTFPRGYITKMIKKLLLRNVDAFLCPASDWDETLIHYGFSKDRIFYGLNTTNSSYWASPVLNTKFGFLPETYFLTVGRQTKMKNLPFFISAYKEYYQEGGRIPLVMVGEGSEHECIMDLAEGSTNIHFLPFQNSDSLKELYARMKALVLPSFRYETWGMVVNECMPIGSIVAVSQECGCASTLVKDGENGFVFNPHDKNEIKRVLHQIDGLSSAKELKMKQCSREIIKEWDVDRFSNGLFDASTYAVNNKKSVKSWVDRMLIRLWKGRYNYKDTLILIVFLGNQYFKLI